MTASSMTCYNCRYRGCPCRRLRIQQRQKFPAQNATPYLAQIGTHHPKFSTVNPARKSQSLKTTTADNERAKTTRKQAGRD